jgi:hypothetical protein
MMFSPDINIKGFSHLLETAVEKGNTSGKIFYDGWTGEFRTLEEGHYHIHIKKEDTDLTIVQRGFPISL